MSDKSPPTVKTLKNFYLEHIKIFNKKENSTILTFDEYKRKFRIIYYDLYKITPDEFLNKTKQRMWKLHEGLLYLLLLSGTGNYCDDEKIIASIPRVDALVYWDKVCTSNDIERAKHPLGKLLKADIYKAFEYSIESKELIEWAKEQPVNFPALNIYKEIKKKPSGRPKGSGYDDSKEVEFMHEFIKQHPSNNNMSDVARRAIERFNTKGASQCSTVKRLIEKYNKKFKD